MNEEKIDELKKRIDALRLEISICDDNRLIEIERELNKIGFELIKASI